MKKNLMGGIRRSAQKPTICVHKHKTIIPYYSVLLFRSIGFVQPLGTHQSIVSFRKCVYKRCGRVLTVILYSLVAYGRKISNSNSNSSSSSSSRKIKATKIAALLQASENRGSLSHWGMGIGFLAVLADLFFVHMLCVFSTPWRVIHTASIEIVVVYGHKSDVSQIGPYQPVPVFPINILK